MGEPVEGERAPGRLLRGFGVQGVPSLTGIPLVQSRHSARIIDMVLGAAIVVRVPPGSAPMTWAQLSLAALVCVALFRRPLRKWLGDIWVPIVFTVLVVFTAAESLAQGVSPWKRDAAIIVLMLVAAFLATGRLDVGSVIKGLIVGLIVNTILFYVGAAPDDYAGTLTGYLQDKNAAGLYYAAGGLLALVVAHRRRWQILLIAGSTAAIILTGSRTSLAAFAAALVWLVTSHRLRRWGQLVLGACLAASFMWANTTTFFDAQRTEVQVGSDWFRSRIDQASAEKTAAAPWFGDGLGQAHVQIDGNRWFFNSSYQGLYVEGGIILAVSIIAIYALYALGLRSSRPDWTQSLDTRAIAAAGIVVFFCAVRLGEVWLSPIGLVVLGVGLANYLHYRDSSLDSVRSRGKSQSTGLRTYSA